MPGVTDGWSDALDACTNWISCAEEYKRYMTKSAPRQSR